LTAAPNAQARPTTPPDNVHWGYIFALLAHFYRFDWRTVMEMTPRQTQHYLSMIRYVSEWSKDAGTVPPLPSVYLSDVELRSEAERAGVRLPDRKTHHAHHGMRKTG
jgi:hypothetical protein